MSLTGFSGTDIISSGEVALEGGEGLSFFPREAFDPPLRPPRPRVPRLTGSWSRWPRVWVAVEEDIFACVLAEFGLKSWCFLRSLVLVVDSESVEGVPTAPHTGSTYGHVTTMTLIQPRYLDIHAVAKLLRSISSRVFIKKKGILLRAPLTPHHQARRPGLHRARHDQDRPHLSISIHAASVPQILFDQTEAMIQSEMS